MDMNPEHYRRPIPKANLNGVAHFFKMVMMDPNFYALREPLLGDLTASEIALAGHLLDVDRDQIRRYLNPLRDIEPSMIGMNKLKSKNRKIMILGADVASLMERILHPEIYWPKAALLMRESGRTPDIPYVWVVALPRDNRGARHQLDYLGQQIEDHVNAFRKMGYIFERKILLEVPRLVEKESIASAAWFGITTPIIGFSNRIKYITSPSGEPMGQLHHDPFEDLACSVSGVSVTFQWDTVYTAASLGMRSQVDGDDLVPYVDVDLDPLVVRQAKKNGIMSMDQPSTSKSPTIILWKMRPNPPRTVISSYEFGLE